MYAAEKVTSSKGYLQEQAYPLLTHISIITPTGLVLFHKSFIRDAVDSSLLSGFVAAILSFSREFNSNLLSIRMDHFLILVKKTKTLVLIVGVKPSANAEDFGASLLREIEASSQFQEIERYWSQEAYQRQEVIGNAIKGILTGLSLEAIEAATPRTVRLQMILSNYIGQIQSQALTPKQASQEIIDHAETNHEPDQIIAFVDLLSQLLKGEIQDTTVQRRLISLKRYLRRHLATQ